MIWGICWKVTVLQDLPRRGAARQNSLFGSRLVQQVHGEFTVVMSIHRQQSIQTRYDARWFLRCAIEPWQETNHRICRPSVDRLRWTQIQLYATVCSVACYLRQLVISILLSLPLLGCCSAGVMRTVDNQITIRGQDSAAATLPEIPAKTFRSGAIESLTPEPAVYLPLTLRDALEAALADSSVVRVLEGRVNVASITPMDVLMAEQRIETERGRFQPRLSGTLDGSRVDQPPNSFFGPGIAENVRRDETGVFARVTQPLTTGGSLSLGLEPPLAYLFIPTGVSAGQYNPIYSVDYVLKVNQPVLRGAGQGVALAPIQIAQRQANQSRWELEEVLNSQIRSVTEGYWRLYAAHLELEAVKSILPLAEESVRIEQLRLQADRSILADVARARFQLDGFQRTQSVMQGNLRKRVLQLRQLVGGQPSVQPLFLPSERPIESPPPENLPALVQVALTSRPALNELRERLSEKRIALRVAENQVLPSLDFKGEYRISGLGERLDTGLRQAATSDYTDWTLGMVMEVPIGNKVALSRRQIAELDMARIHIRLNALEQNVAFEIAELLSELQAQWQRLEIAKRQAQETQEWLRVSKIRYSQPRASSTSQDWLLLALTDLQSAMRSYVDAVSDVGQALAEYNTLLAELNQAQGISVYQWRQQGDQGAVVPYGESPGGHSGFVYHDYRMHPGHVLQAQSNSRVTPIQKEIGRLPTGLPTPSDGFILGHSFINVPVPLEPNPVNAQPGSPDLPLQMPPPSASR